MSITVQVIKRRGRKFYQAEWRDPVTGRIKSKSTRCLYRKDALKFAGKLAAELNEGRYREQVNVTWKTFRERWEAEVGAGLAVKTAALTATVFNHVEEIVSPKLLAALDADQISRLVRQWRESELAEPSVKAYLAHLRAALNWAARINLLQTAPTFTMPRRTRVPRGRAVTVEEFERMLKAVPKVVGDRSTSWSDLLEGLFWSGLRLGEALDLHWTDDRKLSLDFSGRRPMFVVRPDGEKANLDRLLPIAPEFAEWLNGRTADGYVFNPLPPTGCGRARLDLASTTISAIGVAAKIKVKTLRDGSPRFATAHDLRRSFGTRWAKRVLPQVLQRLMRHASIETTLKFYVDEDARELADELWSSSLRPDTKPDTPHFPDTPQDAHSVESA